MTRAADGRLESIHVRMPGRTELCEARWGYDVRQARGYRESYQSNERATSTALAASGA